MHKRKAAGFSLLEMVIALALVAVFVTAMLPVVRDRYDAKRQAATASQIMAYSHAVDAYVRANSTALQAGAGPSTPVAITPAQLTSLLPTGFSFKTPYGQTLSACVTEPTAGDLAPLIVTTGGQILTDLQAIGVAMNITELGGDGGTLDHRNTAQIVGGTGFWRVAAGTCGASPGVGHVADALFVRYAAATDDALHRHASGNPALNTMSTALDMGGNDITNAGQVSATQLVTPAGNGVRVGNSFFYGGPTGNAAIRTPGDLYIDNQAGSAGADIARVHNITGDSGSTFNANTLYSRGNVTAVGAMYASNWFRAQGNSGFYFEDHGGGWYMTDSTWIRAYNDKNIYTPGEIRGGTVHATGSLVTDGVLTINEAVALHGSCSGTGKLAKASNGAGVVECDGNSWERVRSGFTSYTIVAGPTVSGFTHSIATCPAGYTLLSGGFLVPGQPYSEMPGVGESRPISTTQWQTTSTDNRVPVYAIAYCGK